MVDKDRKQEQKPPKDPKSLIFDKDQIAVALKYDQKTSKAPKVVASGKGAIAEQILQLAFANDVKVRQDADLAEILSAVEVDTEIPLEAFAAVAEILAYVYRANGESLDTDTNASPDPAPDTTEGDQEEQGETAEETEQVLEVSKTTTDADVTDNATSHSDTTTSEKVETP